MILKNYSLIISLCFIFSFSQTSAQWSFGIQGGLNIAKYSVTSLGYASKLSSKNGITIGGEINYKINEQLFIFSGLRYDQKGGNLSHNYPNLKGDGKVYFDYLEIPLQLVYAPFDIEIEPILLGGINIGYLLTAKSDLTINNITMTEDIDSKASKIDIFSEVGLGIKPDINDNVSYLFTVSYYYGIYDLDEDITTSGIHFLLGIQFKL